MGIQVSCNSGAVCAPATDGQDPILDEPKCVNDDSAPVSPSGGTPPAVAATEKTENNLLSPNLAAPSQKFELGPNPEGEVKKISPRPVNDAMRGSSRADAVAAATTPGALNQGESPRSPLSPKSPLSPLSPQFEPPGPEADGPASSKKSKSGKSKVAGLNLKKTLDRQCSDLSDASDCSDLESIFSTPRGAGFKRLISEGTAKERLQTAGKCVRTSVRLNRIIRLGQTADVGPVRCAVPFETLMDFDEKARETMGKEYVTANVRDVCKAMVLPQCELTGKAYARSLNKDSPCSGQVFVCHCWDGKFSELILAIKNQFKDWNQKPTLWICLFALLQSRRRTAMKIEDAPFLAALKKADHLLVVRNKEVDIFNRLWPMWEIFTAKQQGLLDKPNGLMLVGPDDGKAAPVDVASAPTSESSDKECILKAIEETTTSKAVEEAITAVKARAKKRNSAAKPEATPNPKLPAKVAPPSKSSAKAQARQKSADAAAERMETKPNNVKADVKADTKAKADVKAKPQAAAGGTSSSKSANGTPSGTRK